MAEYIVSETRFGAIRTLEEALELSKTNENCLKTDETVNIKIDGTLHINKPICVIGENLPCGKNSIIIEGRIPILEFQAE